MNLIISPHDDDSVLFAGILSQRLDGAHVVVVLDSHIQPNRGEFGCSARERAYETTAACEVLGLGQHGRLELRDDTATETDIYCKLADSFHGFAGDVYAPAEQGGNRHHDWVARAAKKAFGGRVIEYTTYTKTELWTRGDIEIVPTAEELDRKNAALACYASQLRINRPHFEAVYGKSEWLNRS